MPNTVQPLSVKKEKSQLKRYRAALLKNPMTMSVVEKSIEIAMDDANPNQMQAIKLIMDRALPTRGFEMENRQADKGGVTINITGLTSQEKEVSTGVTLDQVPDSLEALDD